MKTLSHNVIMIALVVLFGISPVQSINASVSVCMENDTSMNNHMMMSHNNMQHDMTKANASSDSSPDCCKQSKSCHNMHCASAPVAMMTSGPVVNVTYTVNSIHQMQKISLVEFYPPSLYRPPKA